MAIGDSSSGQGHEDWASARYYQRSTTPSAGSGAGLVFARDNPVTESTVVTTTATSAASSAPGGAAGGGAQPVSEGRVGKARRRSRASRKAPTTVLNTDTANFRAMVQQFTGVPTAPFQAGGYPQVAVDVGAGGGPATLSFGLHGGGAGQLYQRQAGFPFGVQQQPPPPQFQQHHERPLFTLGGAGATTSGAYLRPGRGGNPERAGMDASTEGLLLESIPPSQMMSRPAGSSSGSSTTNRFLL